MVRQVHESEALALHVRDTGQTTSCPCTCWHRRNGLCHLRIQALHTLRAQHMRVVVGLSQPSHFCHSKPW